MSSSEPKPVIKIRIIKFRTHVHATESMQKVENALKNLLPEELNGFEPDEYVVEHLMSSFGTPIKCITITISKQQRIKKIIRHLASTLSQEIKEKLSTELDNRIGRKNRFYFRLDKQYLVYNKLELASDSDIIQVTIAPINKNPKAEFTHAEIRKCFIKLGII